MPGDEGAVGAGPIEGDGGDAGAGLEGVEGGAGEGEGGSAAGQASTAASAKDAAPKYKTRRGGKEVELTGAELAKLLDDDYEHEFKGPDNKPLKYKWSQIERAAQRDSGALAAMQRFNEHRAALDREFEYAKDPSKPDNMRAFMEDRLGIEDYDKWLLERAGEVYRKQVELQQLVQGVYDEQGRKVRDPDVMEYNRRMEANARSRFERKQQKDAAIQKAQQDQQRQQQQAEQNRRGVEDAMKQLGIKPTKRVHAIALEIWHEHGKAGMPLSYEQLAQLTREELHQEMYGHIDTLDDDALVKFLGDKRRERIRAIDVAALKGAKKQERAAAATTTPKPPPSSSTQRPTGEVSDRDFRRTFRVGSGV